MKEKIEALTMSLDSILSLVRSRDYKKISETINNIKTEIGELDLDLSELDIYKEFHDKIKDEILNSGKTTVLSISTIDNIRIKTGNKLHELKDENQRKN